MSMRLNNNQSAASISETDSLSRQMCKAPLHSSGTREVINKKKKVNIAKSRNHTSNISIFTKNKIIIIRPHDTDKTNSGVIRRSILFQHGILLTPQINSICLPVSIVAVVMSKKTKKRIRRNLFIYLKLSNNRFNISTMSCASSLSILRYIPLLFAALFKFH